jgi:YD repeat-containing protein
VPVQPIVRTHIIRTYSGKRPQVSPRFPDADFTYDNAGRMTKVADWINSSFGIQYAYDDAGRLSTQKEYAATETLSYTYDAAGHIASMTDPNGQTTTYTYTDTGRGNSGDTLLNYGAEA